MEPKNRPRSVGIFRQIGDTLPARVVANQFAVWRCRPYSGPVTLLVGTALISLLLLLLRGMSPQLPALGVAYLPLIAMLAYYWSWSLVVAAAAIQLLCVYVIFLPTAWAGTPRASEDIAELVVLIAVSGFILALVQLAKNRRDAAEWEAARFASLNAVGIALASERNRDNLLHLIAQTACDLTGASFAAFTLRPVDTTGQPVVPPEGNLFHLAAVVGVTPQQEAVFRRLPLGGEGLLAPIFRYGVPVRVGDIASLLEATLTRRYQRATPPLSLLSLGPHRVRWPGDRQKPLPEETFRGRNSAQ